jgi:hypothetical protein
LAGNVVDSFESQVLARLPLAEAVWVLLRHVASDEVLSRLFEEHRGTGSNRDVSFALLVQLVADALLDHAGSGRQSFQAAREQGTLSATDEAVYGKLRRLPLPLSMAFLRETTRRLRDVLPGKGPELPPSLRRFRVVIVDGKKLKNLPKRLTPLRSVKGKVLGGKVVAGLLLNEGLIVAIEASPDGEANDAPLTPGLMQQCAAEFTDPLLYVADRQFCDLTIPPQIVAAEHSFLIRYSKKMLFSAEKTLLSTDAQGRTIREEWGWLGSAKDQRRMYLRRITLERPSEEEVSLLTNLLDAEEVPAQDLLATYLNRWSIERVFQQVTEVFHLQRFISSTPNGAIFQFALCSLLYNVLQVVRGYLAMLQQRPPQSLSSEMIFHSVCDQLTACTQLVPLPTLIAAASQPQTPTAVRERLTILLANQWSQLWKKSPPKKKSPPHPQRAIRGGHSSAWKLLHPAQPPPS